MQAGKSRRFTIMGVRRAAPSLFCSSASRQRASRWTALAGEFTCQTNKGVKSLSIAPRGRYCIRSSNNAGIRAVLAVAACQKTIFAFGKRNRTYLACTARAATVNLSSPVPSFTTRSFRISPDTSAKRNEGGAQSIAA